MSAMSDYLENKCIDHIFRGTAYTAPAGLWVGLYTATPSDAGGGTEVTGGSYARVSVPPSTANWTATQGGTSGASTGTGGTTTNAATITFPTATANWGTAVAVGIFDAASAGNLLWWGPLSSSQSIPSGVTYSIAAGALSVQVDN